MVMSIGLAIVMTTFYIAIAIAGIAIDNDVPVAVAYVAGLVWPLTLFVFAISAGMRQ